MMLRSFFCVLLISTLAACGDDGGTDGGPDGSADAGTCDCCGTSVLINPGEVCTDAVCAPYCVGDAAPDTGRRDTSTPDASMDGAVDAMTDATMDGAPMDGAPMDSAVTDAAADASPDAAADASDAAADVPPGSLATGTSGCTADVECVAMVCWDFNDYDSLCGGSVCSVSCGDAADCVSAATTAGAATPGAATCGSDGRCDFVGTGLGMFFCA